MFRFLSVAALLLPLVAHATSACPASFQDYLSTFQRDPSFQKKHRQYPLRYSFIDTDTEPEPKTVKRWLSAAQTGTEKKNGVSFPSLQTVTAKTLERKVTKATGETYVVRFDKPDSDVYSIEFHFSRIRHCWRLVEVNDFSM